MLILFNKPYGVLTQFRDASQRKTLASYIPFPQIYAAGRLDRDSEGLLVLTDDGVLNHRITHPQRKLAKTYWVQVEGIPDETALDLLRKGINLKDGPTAPAKAKLIEQPPGLWGRDPPVRYRAKVPTRWLAITLTEGRNRQVRRMTAAVGFPTLRLIRCRIGPWQLGNLAPGQWVQATVPPQFANLRRGGRDGPHRLRTSSQGTRTGARR